MCAEICAVAVLKVPKGECYNKCILKNVKYKIWKLLKNLTSSKAKFATDY